MIEQHCAAQQLHVVERRTQLDAPRRSLLLVVAWAQDRYAVFMPRLTGTWEDARIGGAGAKNVLTASCLLLPPPFAWPVASKEAASDLASYVLLSRRSAVACCKLADVGTVAPSMCNLSLRMCRQLLFFLCVHWMRSLHALPILPLITAKALRRLAGEAMWSEVDTQMSISAVVSQTASRKRLYEPAASRRFVLS
eukprot:CAMPEP_0206454904 /NCGR_PEP_ID=MMETSP0324_2-20121206/21423_1 /ASSEMBLY_ACC=CAM_ASM_000836 /TAXON_ID=2866 /ORGANISM="Crypthecodinium cohnii, Strain Seligo" /LENGTH=194 /DNA_ID=CAMNT_0053925483 /DNA_START=222 /DNA_END=807 /DNA_ORIENTATION=+